MTAHQLFRELTYTRDQITRVARLLSFVSNQQEVLNRLSELQYREATYNALMTDLLLKEDKVRKIAQRSWTESRKP